MKISIQICNMDHNLRIVSLQALQKLTPLEPPSFGAKMPSALALIDAPPPPSPRPAHGRRPVSSTTPAPILTTTPAPVLSSPPSTRPHKNMKLRPAYTPIPTPAPAPAPSYGRVPARVPSRVISRPATTTPYTPVRISTTTAAAPSPRPAPTARPSRGPARRPKFESARVGSKARPNRPSVTGRRPSSSGSYRTPTPTTTPTTTTHRTYDSRVPSGSAPRRQYVRKQTATRPDEAPVYRTSTKAYRAPSSLYHVRAPTTTVTAPAQPDFVQSGECPWSLSGTRRP